jgi:uncharacterized protein (DUF1800 family)
MVVSARDLNAAIAVTRFGLGARPGEIEAVAHDPRGWLEGQIRSTGADQPVGVPFKLPPQVRSPSTAEVGMSGIAVSASGGGMTAADPPAAPFVADFAPDRPLPTMQAAFRAFGDYQQQRKADKGDPAARRLAVAPILIGAGEEILARVQLAATTPAGFRERWTLFWANHFTMAAKGLPETAAVGPFEREAIRPHVFGRFEDLLIASSGHPGMLLYLDQAQSIGPNSQAGFRRGGKAGLNENLGREILELHTVGADAGYVQADVTEFARALTGWSMGGANGPADQQGAFVYRANFHEPGPRTIMGKTYADGGRDQALKVLRDLAADPRTAERLARKIAAHFVADDPPPALVERLRGAYLRTRGDLAEMAMVLIASSEAWNPAPRKFKTPYEYLVSSYRAAGAVPRDPNKEIVQPLQALGMRPFSAPQPNGWSDVGVDWAAPDAIVKRLTWAQGFADAHTPQSTPSDEARLVLGARLTDKTLMTVSRAETRSEAFAILLMSPEFQRR